MAIHKIVRKKIGASNQNNYVGNSGEIFLNDGIPDLRLSDGVTPGGISLSSGISTSNVNTGYANTAGISTLSRGLTGTPNISVGVVTATTYYGNGSNLTGIITSLVGVATSGDLVGLASEGYVDAAVSGLSTFSGDYNDLINQPLIPSIVGLASEGYVDAAIVGFITSGSLSGYASEGYVDAAIVGFITSGSLSGYASEGYVDAAIVGFITSGSLSGFTTSGDLVGFITSGSLSGFATEGYVNTQVGLSTSGLLSSTGHGSSLTGIVTSIEAGAGISIDQSTGKVTITNTGGGGGGGIVGLTIRDENVTVGTAGSITTVNFVGDNITATASGTISTITVATPTYIQTAGIATYATTAGVSTTTNTIDITNTNGLTTIYYPTFVESRTSGQYLRADVDLSYRTDTNTLTIGGGVSATSVNASGIITANSFRPSSGYYQSGSGTNAFYVFDGTGNVSFQGTIGVNQINNGSGYKAIEFTGSTTPTVLIPNDLNVTGIITGSSFVKSGGTSSQFLKADGSVDSSTYLTANSGASLSGNNVFTGINTFTGSNTFSGSIVIEQASEAFNKYSTTINSGATVTLDCSTGNIHYITSSVGGNWTANLTNVGISSGFCANYTLVITQGATAYIPSSIQIGGVSQTINWQGGSQPSGNNNKKDVIAYTVFNDGGAYTIFGQLVTFG